MELVREALHAELEAPLRQGHSGGLGMHRGLQAEEKQPLQWDRDSGESCNCTPANGKVKVKGLWSLEIRY